MQPAVDVARRSGHGVVRDQLRTLGPVELDFIAQPALNLPGRIAPVRVKRSISSLDEMLEIARRAGEETVEADHLVAGFEQPIAELGADKAGAAGHENRSAVEPVYL